MSKQSWFENKSTKKRKQDAPTFAFSTRLTPRQAMPNRAMPMPCQAAPRQAKPCFLALLFGFVDARLAQVAERYAIFAFPGRRLRSPSKSLAVLPGSMSINSGCASRRFGNIVHRYAQCATINTQFVVCSKHRIPTPCASAFATRPITNFVNRVDCTSGFIVLLFHNRVSPCFVFAYQLQELYHGFLILSIAGFCAFKASYMLRKTYHSILSQSTASGVSTFSHHYNWLSRGNFG